MRLASNFDGVGSGDRGSSRRIYWNRSDGALRRIPHDKQNADCGAYSECNTAQKGY